MSFGEILATTIIVFLSFDIISEYVRRKIITAVDSFLDRYEREKERQKIERTCQECINYINREVLKKGGSNENDV